MSDQNGKWLPYNQDGSQHDCKKEKKTKENGQNQITLESVLRKLETHGIIINVDRLMAQ
jgi:hypothetical protein